ncbi:hypothetical protein AWC38_SpisGene10228 [Stylophora pistillata]|uniref:Uncharacterized protein n=1 Tax=Stylophora pistillata TaxID=50429 RepID=A0A2B4S8M3_STYPI|nr:hypothetical protein AWC38_SpisGene10228 [Stylophora pistillata]
MSPNYILCTIPSLGEREHTAARPKDTQDIDPYSRHTIKKIESSRADLFLVKSQTGQSEHGSLRFTIYPPTQKYRSERVGSRDQQSSSSSRRVTEPEGGEIDTPVKSTIQMPGNFVQTGARPKEKIDGRDGSGNKVSASSTGLVTEPLLNFAKGSEMDHHVPSTIQMPLSVNDYQSPPFSNSAIPKQKQTTAKDLG